MPNPNGPRRPRGPISTLAMVCVAAALAACGAGSGAAAESTPSALPAVTISGPAGAASPLPAVGVTIVPGDPTPGPGQPSATAEVVVGPETYPPGINPLTGLLADPRALDRRPLAIKITNFPRYVRPQSGLSLADVVFEHYSEGGTTRFTAIYYGADAPRVGPVRSARLIDTVVPEMYRAALVASGSSAGVIQRLRFKEWFNLFVAEATGYQCPPLCRESEDTNSLYVNTVELQKILSDKGLGGRQPYRGVAFFSRPAPGGAPANLIRVQFSGEAFTEWRYNPASGRYERWADASAPPAVDSAGTPIARAPIIAAHLDIFNSQPISAANVVVLFVNHVVDFSIPEDFDTGGFTGHFSTEVQLWGTGPAWLFRDGQGYELTWVRLNKGDMVGLVDSANQLVPFKPGSTWYEVVGLASERAASGADWAVRHKSPVDKGEIPGVPTPTPTLEGTPEETPAAPPGDTATPAP